MANKTLYVGNISYGSTEESLMSTFAAYGGSNVRIIEGRGFAFVDLCNNRFDVVVMNPPFGAYAVASVQRLAGSFPDASKDLYPCFIERWVQRCEMLGAIKIGRAHV